MLVVSNPPHSHFQSGVAPSHRPLQGPPGPPGPLEPPEPPKPRPSVEDVKGKQVMTQTPMEEPHFVSRLISVQPDSASLLTISLLSSAQISILLLLFMLRLFNRLFWLCKVVLLFFVGI